MKLRDLYKGILIIAISVITGCHMIKVKSNDDQYLYARSAPSLVVPEGASSEKLHNDYPISGNRYPTSRHSVSQVPPNGVAALRG